MGCGCYGELRCGEFGYVLAVELRLGELVSVPFWFGLADAFRFG